MGQFVADHRAYRTVFTASSRLSSKNGAAECRQES